jgi:hypothetical protein
VFSDVIFTQFKIDTHKYPTLSSLSFGIYRSNFLDKDVKIPLISGKMFEDIKKGYTGGCVGVFCSGGNRWKDLFHYDINSLYPYVMKTFQCH